MATELTANLITAAEFQDLTFDVPVELVRGEIIELTRPGLRHGVVCGNVCYLLRNWAEKAQTFVIASNDTGVITERDPDSLRGPDVLVIRRERLPKGQLQNNALEIVPDLTVEVLSPHDRWNQILDKSSEYLDAGVGEVWVVDPEEQTVHVFRSDAAPRNLQGEESLQSESLLPGFSTNVSNFFTGI